MKLHKVTDLEYGTIWICDICYSPEEREKRFHTWIGHRLMKTKKV